MSAVGGGSGTAAARRLLVTVLECRGLKKMDGRFGDNDVFVTVDVDGQQLSTQTVQDGGTAPRWNGGAGEALLFSPHQEPQMLLVSAYDADTTVADKVLDRHSNPVKDLKAELIGSERVSLKYAAGAAHFETASKRTAIGEDWSSCEWYTLTDEKDNKTGEVRLFLRWAVPPPANAPMEWQLHATVLECRNLKKMDVIGKNDVYVRLHAHGAKSSARTTTVEEGGAAPKWGTEPTPGEDLDLQLSGPPPALGVEVWEEDKLKDELIGCSVLELGTEMTKDGWAWSGWSELTDCKRGKVSGEVRLQLVWRYVEVGHEPALIAGDGTLLQVTILECRGLKNVDGFRGLNDVFVAADVDGNALTSSVIDDGGSAPRWNGGAGELLEFTPKAEPKSLRLGVMDKNKSADKEIGHCGIPLDKPADENRKSCEWYELTDDEGKAAGEIRVFLRWVVAEPALPIPEGDSAAPQEWVLQATVVACSGLKKMDAFGKNDVYVRVNALGERDGKRTRTIEEGGEAPVWGDGAGEVLNMWLNEAPPAVGIEVFEQDKLSSDLIGCHVIEVGTALSDSEWKTEGWYDLTDQAKGAHTGKVHVQLLWRRAPAIDPAGRRLRVTVLECRNLRKMDLVGDNDVYVAIHVDGEVLKTPVIDGGGAAPRWNGGSGQELVFTPRLGDPQSMLVQCFDQDKSADELIGAHACSLAHRLYREDWRSADWYALHDANGENSGEVRLFVRWSVPPAPKDELEQLPTRGEWHLQTTVFECRGLKQMEKLGENDVYVAVHAMGAKKSLRTSTIDEGGATPLWGGGSGEALHMYMDESPPSVGIEVFEEDKLASDLIGCHVLEVGSRIGRGQWSTEGWLDLTDCKTGKITGQIRVELTWKLAPAIDPKSRRLLVAVLECRGLKKMDRLGQNDVFVSVEVDDEEMSSSVRDGGGAAPKWNGGAGEALLFTPLFEPQRMRIQVFDQDQTSDELIGTHVEFLGRRYGRGQDAGADGATVRLTHPQKLLAAYEDQAEGAGADPSSAEEAVAQVLEDICQAVEEVTDAQAAALKDGNDWASCEWYDVIDEHGRITGAVRLFLRWAVPLPPTSPRQWQLLTTVFECSSLKSMGILGKNDVFVKVHALRAAKTKAKPDGSERTNTIKEGGAAPSWGDAGEELDLRLFEVPPAVGIEVYEEGLIKSDLIGCHALDVGTHIGEGEWEAEGWYELSDNSGAIVGRVRLKLSWLIAPAEDISYAAARISGDWRRQRLIDEHRRRERELDTRRRDVKKMKMLLGSTSNKKSGPRVRHVENLDKCMHVTVLECRALKKMGRGLNDPYMAIDVDGQTIHSSTVHSGGAAPCWGSAAGEPMMFRSSVEPGKLCVRVFDHNTIGEDELIGSHNVVLGALASTRRGKKSGPGIDFRKAHLASEELYDLSDSYAMNAYRTSTRHGDTIESYSVQECVEQIMHDVCKAVSDSAEATIAAAKAGRDWSTCEWLSLTDEQGKVAGEARVFLRWGAPPLADSLPCEWQLHATVIECTKLKSVAKLGSNDVFVQVHALGADSSVRTSTIKEGGASPVWRHGDGERLELCLRQAPPAVGIQVYDEGALSNTLIGSQVFEVASQIGVGPYTIEEWFELTDFKAGKPAGRVHMRLEWALMPTEAAGVTRRLTWSGALDAEDAAEQAAAELVGSLMAAMVDQVAADSAQPEPTRSSSRAEEPLAADLPTYACLEACVIECRGLKQMQLFEVNNVVVALNLDGDTQRSATVHDGGAAPAWGGGAGHRMIFRSRKAPSTLRIRAFSEDDDDAALIGSHELSLKDRWKLESTGSGEERQSYEWFPLADGHGEPAGEVRLFLRWRVPRLWRVPEWRLHVSVLACSDLKKMDTLGKNDVFVQVNVLGADKTMRTRTIEGGGSAPVWSSDREEEPMVFKLGEAPPSIGIEVFDEDHVVAYTTHATQHEHRGRDDRLIGFHVFELWSKLQRRAEPTMGDWSTDGWLELKDRTGRPAGRVRARFEWLHDSFLPPDPAPLPKQEREVCFLLDEAAHEGGTLNRTVTFLQGSVKSLQEESSSRFNRGSKPTRFQRSSQIFRDECLPGLSYTRSFADAYQQCDVQLVYVVDDGLEGVCAQPVDDPLLVERVRHELEKRWVYVDRKAERKAAMAAGIVEEDDGGDDDSPPFWQLWVGPHETPEIVFEEPAPLSPQPPITLASVTTDAELAALGTEQRLYAALVRAKHRQLPSEVEQDAAAIAIQTRSRGHLARQSTRAQLKAEMMVQRCCHRYVARAELRRRREEYLRKKAEAEAEAALRARYDSLVSRANTMASAMDDALVDMRQIIGVNETTLKGTAGWTVYAKARQKEADAALATLRRSVSERSSGDELQYALDLYMSCAVADLTEIEQMRERVAARRVAEKDATAKLRASTTQYTGQAEALVAQFQAKVDDPHFVTSQSAALGQTKSRREDRILKAGETRRWAMEAVLFDYQRVVDKADEEGTAASAEIANAREVHAKLRAEEEARVAKEAAIADAKDVSLNLAFHATMLHMFSPDRADGKTAYERTLEAAAAAKKREEWAIFDQKFNSEGEEIVPPPNDGRALGIFRKLPGDGRGKKVMAVASSNELISPAYAAMIASRHPEEKRRRRRPEAEAAKKYSYSAETDPFQLLRMPHSKKRRPQSDSPAQQLHPLLEDRASATATAALSTDVTAVAEGEESSALADWGSTAGSSAFAASSAAAQTSPSHSMTDWQLAMAHPGTPPRLKLGLPPATPPGKHSALRRRVSGRRSGQGLTSGSPGDFSRGKESFLEGWTQFAAVQLDRGGGIPALGSSNPVRALGSVSRTGRTRLSRDAHEQLGGRQ